MGRLRFSTLAVAGFVVGLLPSAPLAMAAKPNILVFLADDMGIGDTSSYLNQKLEAGSTPIAKTLKTPNMERLAQMGTLFNDVHTSSSMCSTTRYGLLTGRYAQRSLQKTAVPSAAWVGQAMIDDDRRTMATLLGGAGYDTEMIGKWHLGTKYYTPAGDIFNYTSNFGTEAQFNSIRWPTAGNPNVTSLANGPHEHGFDYYYGMVGNHETAAGDIRGYFENDTFQGVPVWNVGPVATGFDVRYVGQTLGNKALDRIDAYAAPGGLGSEGKPLFMYYASMANHSDYAPAPTINLQGQTFAVQGASRYTDSAITPAGARSDMVYENDVILGEMLDKLQNTIDPQTGGPMIDNTLVIFTSDNGADDNTNTFLSSGQLKGNKKSIYEGGTRVPFIASWAGKIPAGAVSDQLFGLNDLYASFASLTGQNLGSTEAEDSENILPALYGASTSAWQRPTDLVEHDNTRGNDLPSGAALAIRYGNMKLIVNPTLVNNTVPPSLTPPAGQASPVALFDLSVDPHEDNNLVSNPAYASLVSRLTSELLQNYNQGFSRSTMRPSGGALFATDGGTDNANAYAGSVGFQFTAAANVSVNRLGMWDDAATDVAFQENRLVNPDGDTVGAPDGLAQAHFVRLFDKTTGLQIANVQITNANSYLDGEFRYVNLASIVSLTAGNQYALTMSTAVTDGDMYHLPVQDSGTTPIPATYATDFLALRSTTDGIYPTLLQTGTTASGGLNDEQFAFRYFLGPTLGVTQTPSLYAADFNGDGLIDGADLLVWQRGVGKANPLFKDGDANDDGVIDVADVIIWQNAFVAAQQAAAVPLFASVPEPGSVTLACAALGGVGVMRRRSAPGSARG